MIKQRDADDCADEVSTPLGITPAESDSELRTYIFENEFQNKKVCDLETALELTGHGRYNYLVLFTCSVIINGACLDLFGYATVVAAASCDLNLDLTRLGLLAASPFAGFLFAFPWGYYADTRGRRRAMILSTGVGFVFAVISSFSTHWLFMLIMKVIGSSFSMASFTLTTVMLGESTNKKQRSQYLFIMNSFNLIADFFSFSLAWLILPLNINLPLSWLGTSFRPWRLYTISLAIPLGIGACLMFWLNESPKYLASRGKFAKALGVLTNIYERNGGKRGKYSVTRLIQSPTDFVNSLSKQSLWSSLKKQTLPIFQRPLLWRTIQLIFLLTLCCTTNNVFVMWYPTIVNSFFNSFNEDSGFKQTFCERVFMNTNTSLIQSSLATETYKCNDELSDYTLYAGMLYGLFYCGCGLSVVKIASRPRLLIILILLVSGISFLLVNTVNHPIANMVFFMLLQDTSLGTGCIATYYVDLYPTTHRALISSLCMMIAHLSALTGVTLIGNIITRYCEVTFYAWSVFVFGGIFVCLFLPADRKTGKSLHKDGAS